jgi:D-alanine-D-alanine ligase
VRVWWLVASGKTRPRRSHYRKLSREPHSEDERPTGSFTVPFRPGINARALSPLRIGLLYDRFGDAERPAGAPPDWDAEYEPEATIAALEAALRRLGHEPVRIGNVRALLARLCRQPGEAPLALDAAVNIAESYGSRNREAHAPVLLELAGVPFVGSDALTLSLSLDKAWTKDVLQAVEIATPEYRVFSSTRDVDDRDLPQLPVIVKPRYEGTAKGIAPSSRCESPGAVRAEVERQTSLYEQDVIVERFVTGGEFTVAVVGHDPPLALPVLQRATERNSGIGLHALERHERPEAPFAYDLLGSIDPVLEIRLKDLALRAYRKLEVRDFARVDFRVDRNNKPWFIEINPLPTFAPDGTFAIIAELAGRSYIDFLADVLSEALRRVLGKG